MQVADKSNRQLKICFNTKSWRSENQNQNDDVSGCKSGAEERRELSSKHVARAPETASILAKIGRRNKRAVRLAS